MSAKDINWGRGGGRDLHPSVVLPGAIPAACDCITYLAVEATIGEACWACGSPIRRVKEPAQ